MRAVFLVPHHGQEPERDAAWARISKYYSDFELFPTDTPGPFNLCGARNLAAQRAGDWDVAVFHNADVVAPIVNIERAIDHTAETGRITVPWDSVYLMTAAGHTAGVDSRVPCGNAKREQLWVAHSHAWLKRYGPSAIQVIRRDTFEAVGPWDERFILPQPEDATLLINAGGFDRLSGPLYHFWHQGSEPPERDLGVPWAEYRARYFELLGRGEFEQRLIDEDRTITNFGDWWWG